MIAKIKVNAILAPFKIWPINDYGLPLTEFSSSLGSTAIELHYHWKESFHPFVKTRIPYCTKIVAVTDITGFAEKYVILPPGIPLVPGISDLHARERWNVIQACRNYSKVVDEDGLLDEICKDGPALVTSGRIIKIGDFYRGDTTKNKSIPREGVDLFLSPIKTWQGLAMVAAHNFLPRLAEKLPAVREELLDCVSTAYINEGVTAAWLDAFPEDFNIVEHLTCRRGTWHAKVWTSKTHCGRVPEDFMYKYIFNPIDQNEYDAATTKIEKLCICAKLIADVSQSAQRKARMHAAVRILNTRSTKKEFMEAFNWLRDVFRYGKAFATVITKREGDEFLDPKLRPWFAEATAKHILAAPLKHGAAAAHALCNSKKKKPDIFGIDWINDPYLGKIMKQLSLEIKLSRK